MKGFELMSNTFRSFIALDEIFIEAAMKKHLTGLAEWSSPEAGMFFLVNAFLFSGNRLARIDFLFKFFIFFLSA